MKYWIGVISADHVNIGKQNGFCAFSHGKRQPVEKMNKGDLFIYYSPKTAIEGGEPVQCFTGLGQITDDEPFQGDWGGFDPWVRRATYKNYGWLPVRPLLEDLKFVVNPQRWGMAFRRGHFEITQPDFDYIEAAMKSVPNDQN